MASRQVLPILPKWQQVSGLVAQAWWLCHPSQTLICVLMANSEIQTFAILSGLREESRSTTHSSSEAFTDRKQKGLVSWQDEWLLGWKLPLYMLSSSILRSASWDVTYLPSLLFVRWVAYTERSQMKNMASETHFGDTSGGFRPTPARTDWTHGIYCTSLDLSSFCVCKLGPKSWKFCHYVTDHMCTGLWTSDTEYHHYHCLLICIIFLLIKWEERVPEINC